MRAYTPTNRIGSFVNGTSVTEVLTKNYQYEVTGTLIKVDAVQTYDSGFMVRKFVLLDDSSYPTPLCFDLIKEDVSMTNDLAVGVRLKVIFKLNGREWNGRHFTNLQAIRIDREAQTVVANEEEDEEISF